MKDLDPTYGSFTQSQKDKLEKMKNWDKYPFHLFDCKKTKNKNCFSLVKKHDKVAFVECKIGRVNKTCTNRMCKKSCVKFALISSTKCKCKDHRKAMKDEQKQLMNAEVLVDGVDTIE